MRWSPIPLVAATLLALTSCAPTRDSLGCEIHKVVTATHVGQNVTTVEIDDGHTYRFEKPRWEGYQFHSSTATSVGVCDVVGTDGAHHYALRDEIFKGSAAENVELVR